METKVPNGWFEEVNTLSRIKILENKEGKEQKVLKQRFRFKQG